MKRKILSLVLSSILILCSVAITPFSAFAAEVCQINGLGYGGCVVFASFDGGVLENEFDWLTEGTPVTLISLSADQVVSKITYSKGASELSGFVLTEHLYRQNQKTLGQNPEKQDMEIVEFYQELQVGEQFVIRIEKYGALVDDLEWVSKDANIVKVANSSTIVGIREGITHASAYSKKYNTTFHCNILVSRKQTLPEAAGEFIKKKGKLLYRPIVDGVKYYYYQIKNGTVMYQDDRFFISKSSADREYLLDASGALVLNEDICIKVASLMNNVQNNIKHSGVSSKKKSLAWIKDLEKQQKKIEKLLDKGDVAATMGTYGLKISNIAANLLTNRLDKVAEKTIQTFNDVEKDIEKAMIDEITLNTIEIFELSMEGSLATAKNNLETLIDILDTQYNYDNGYLQNFDHCKLFYKTDCDTKILIEHCRIYFKYVLIDVDEKKAQLLIDASSELAEYIEYDKGKIGKIIRGAKKTMSFTSDNLVYITDMVTFAKALGDPDVTKAIAQIQSIEKTYKTVSESGDLEYMYNDPTPNKALSDMF